MNDEEIVSSIPIEASLPPDGTDSPKETAAVGSAEPLAGESVDLPEAAESARVSDHPLPDSDPAASADSDASETKSLEQLRGELTALRRELSAREDFYRRVGSDYEDFRQLYPDTELAVLPDSVWHDVERGIPIAAAYALAEQRRRRLEAQAESVNHQNSRLSSGALASTEPELFSPAEVRAMSQDEVRLNYQKILKSMQKWI